MHTFLSGPTLFRALVEAAPDAILALDGEGSIVFANPAAERLLEWPPGGLAGHTARELGLPEGAAAFTETGKELPACTRTGKPLRVEVTRAGHDARDGHLVTLFLHDVTRRSEAERRLRLEHAVARALAGSATWAEAVPPLLRSLCEGMGWEAGIFWEAEPDAPVLCYGGAWRAPASPAAPFLELSRRLAFLPGVGLPGQVWEARAPVWVSDLAREPGLSRASVATGSGLRCAFAFPVLLEGEVFGVVELASRDASEPDPDWREALAAVGSAIAQFVLRKRSEAALAEREKRFRSLIEYASDVITLLDARGIIRYASPAVTRMLGYAPDELVGTDVFALVHPDDAPRTRKALALSIRTPTIAISLEYRCRHRDGSWRTLESVGRSLLHDRAVGGVVVNSRDVTSRRKMEDEVRRLSLTDELTGLHNRRGFFVLAAQRLREAQRAGTELLLVFADLDGLKAINDRFGHAAGDAALAGAAAVLSRTFRQSDVLARVGGDEFVVLAELSRAHAGGVVERLEQRVRDWNAARAGCPPLSMSVGTAWYTPGKLDTVEALLREADAAMYARKRQRGGGAPPHVS